MDPEQVVLDVDHPGSGECPIQHVQVGAHGGGRMLVGQPEHLVDHPVVRHAQAQGQPAPADRLGREDLVGERDRVARLDRDHRGADLDPGGPGPDEGCGRQRVEVVGDLRYPERRESGVLGPLGVVQHPLHLGGVAAPLGADHHADPHAETLQTAGSTTTSMLAAPLSGTRAWRHTSTGKETFTSE